MEAFEPDLVEILIGKCLAPENSEREHAFEQLSRRLAAASERLHLLDAHLARLSAPVLAGLNQNETESPTSAVSGKEIDVLLLQRCARVWCLFCSVRGVSRLAKLFPHEMSCAEPVLQLLARGNWEWETCFVLLSWLAELVLIPIALSRVLRRPEQLLEVGKQLLRAPGKPSSAASVMLARLVARPDCVDLVSPFFAWCLDELNGSDADLSVYSVLALSLSTCPRETVLPLASSMLARLTTSSSSTLPSVLRRKALLKVVERLGLVFLAPRLAPWRYQRGSRLLVEGLFAKGENRGLQLQQQHVESDNKENKEEETWFVPSEVDRVMHLLLEGLQDRDSVVRWRAAKGVGRVCERLPAAFADEAGEAALELCGPGAGESGWHGACLAAAELARRGLLRPARLSAALPALLEALRFDAVLAARVAGPAVRDAACYAFWAMARAYGREVLIGFAASLGAGLLECAALDREPNCRRAASAALQEHIGRAALFEHGLQLVQITDYFRLASVKVAYLEVAPEITVFPEYGPWFVDAVVERKLVHWDIHIREASASLFGIMAGQESCKFAVLSVLPRLREMSVHPTLPEVRHGALLALAHSVRAVAGSVDVTSIIPELEAARLFRGKGGEHVRVAACVLTEKISEAQVALTLDLDRIKPHLNGRPDSGKTCAKRHKEFLDECLRNASEEVQVTASAALRLFATSYLGQLETKVRRAIVNAYCALLEGSDQVGSFTRGAARALGALPSVLFDEESDKDAQRALARAVKESTDQETRTIAVGSLKPCASSVLACLGALCDHTTDERGDVGWKTRAAACEAVPRLLSSFQRDFEVAAAVSRLAEAVAGRLDRLRRPARIALAAMARTFPSLAHLSRLFPEDKEEKKEEEKEDQEWWLVACSCLEEPGAVASGALAGLAAAAGLRAPDERPREALLRFVAARPELQRRLWCSLLPRLLGDVPDDEVSSGEIPEEVGKMGRLAGHSLALLDALLRNGCLESALSPSRAASLGCAVLRLVDEESQVWGSVVALTAAADVLCSLLRAGRGRAALLRAARLLAHRWPRVRQHCALQLHLALALGSPLMHWNRIEVLLLSAAAQDSTEIVAEEVWKLLGDEKE